MNKVAAVNQLSREIAEGKHSVDELEQCLYEIEHMPEKKYITQIIASGIGGAGFCFLLGGDFPECWSGCVGLFPGRGGQKSQKL